MNNRIEVLAYKRYKVCKNLDNGVFTLWYGTSLLYAGSRKDIINRFRSSIKEFERMVS